MFRLFLILVLIAGLMTVGCNKKQDEIEALQDEATGADAEAVLDSLEGSGEMAEDAVEESVPATPKEPPVKKKPEPEPDYSQAEGYVIQIGSYSDYELASYWAEKYLDREYKAFLREVEIGGETLYRLRIGVYDTFQEAKDAGELLSDRYSLTYWIDYNR